MNSIDVIIPTMWECNKFIEYLETYVEIQVINKIYIIDNQYLKNPKSKVLLHPKITLIDYKKNIYVNPAWNEGFYRSNADILCLLNDDIFVGEEVFNLVSELDIKNIDIIGSYLKGTIDNYNIDPTKFQSTEIFKLNVNKTQAIGGQSYAFGVCMFIKRSSYTPIPSLYKVWYGDDYLIQNCENIYVIKTNCIHGEISKTIVNNRDSINPRISLDTDNAYRFSHFKNGKNWISTKKNNHLKKIFLDISNHDSITRRHSNILDRSYNICSMDSK